MRIDNDQAVVPLRLRAQLPCDALIQVSRITAEMLTLTLWKLLVAVSLQTDTLRKTSSATSHVSANNSHVDAESDVS